MTERDQPLPGMTEPTAAPSPLEAATRRTIAALDADGHLDESHAVLLQLCLTLARAIDAGSRHGKASAVAMAARELRETFLALIPEDSEGGESDEWSRFLDQLDAAATRDPA